MKVGSLTKRFAFLASALAAISFGQSNQPTQAIDLLTPVQQKEIGLSHMTSAERVALNKAITDLILKAVEYGKQQCSQAVTPDSSHSQRRYVPGGGHWIRDNSGGKIITLEDGSIWQVSEIDQIDTMLWLPITDVTVVVDNSPIGEYGYILINKDDAEKAHVKYLGRE